MERASGSGTQKINAADQEIRFAARSHIGASPKRELLEDRSRVELIRTGSGTQIVLGVVADGIGGENAGERAAEVTVETIFEYCTKSIEADIPSMLRNALEEANQRVYSEARRSRRKMNMGSTASVAGIVNGRLYLAQVGDSRIYLIRGDQVRQLTIDHTWENEVVRIGRLSLEEAAKHPRRDEIVRSIGYEKSVEVDLGIWLGTGSEDQSAAEAAQGFHLQPTDRILICSDGVTKPRHDKPTAHYVEEAEFPDLIRGRKPEQGVDALLKRARSRNVDDNVSAVLLEMVGEEKVRIRLPSTRTVGIVAMVLTLVVGGIYLIPKVLQNTPEVATAPPIADLPAGVAYLSELQGLAELQLPGSIFQSMKIEQILSAGKDVL
jgi:protein phosphatase